MLGGLQAVGTPAQPITFTSAQNSGPGEWSGLVFDGGTGRLRYVTVRYSGQGNSLLDWAASAIAVRNARPAGACSQPRT